MTGKPLGTKAAVEAMKQISEQGKRRDVTCPECTKAFKVRLLAKWANCPDCLWVFEVRV